MNRRQIFNLLAGAAIVPCLPWPARAQSWPSRPVRIVVGYPPGIAPDIVARLVGERLSSRLGQQFIVENRPGAGTNIAAENVVRAPADGYTLLLVAAANTINMALNPNLDFNFIADIAPVASFGGVVFIMAVNPSFPAKTLGEFIAYAKANPGKINFASRGIGSSTHVFGEMFKMLAGVDLVHVPYRNDYKADLFGGRVQVAFFAIADALGDVRNGTIRALAVTTATRFAALPELPTIREIVPGYEASGWLGIGAPMDTPAAVIEKLNSEINAVIADPALHTHLLELGIEPDPMPVAEFRAFIAADADRWAKVVRFADIKPE